MFGAKEQGKPAFFLAHSKLIHIIDIRIFLSMALNIKECGLTEVNDVTLICSVYL
jgi:hypothetical protein